MATITITIPTAKEAKALEGFLELYPNTEMKPNPEFIDSVETKNIDEFLDEKVYTNKQWVNEKMKRILVRDIHRGLDLKNRKENTLSVDDSIVE